MDAGWLSQMRKGVLELCLLAVVAREETYGYAIVETLAAIPGMEVTESTVYPLLARLASDGQLSQRMAKSPQGPSRRYYSLTPMGRRRLSDLAQAWTMIGRSIQSLLDDADHPRTS